MPFVQYVEYIFITVTTVFYILGGREPCGLYHEHPVLRVDHVCGDIPDRYRPPHQVPGAVQHSCQPLPPGGLRPHRLHLLLRHASPLFTPTGSRHLQVVALLLHSSVWDGRYWHGKS